MSIVKDQNLAPAGRRKINWVRDFMPALGGIEARFEQEQPFAGLRVAVSVHLEAKTANLGYVLAKGGAEVRLTGSNPLSTPDDVAAGLADMGVETFGIHGAMGEEYENLLIETLKFKPHLIVDDGGDLIHLLGGKCADLGEHLIGGCEETTTGILRLKAREREGILPCPMMAVTTPRPSTTMTISTAPASLFGTPSCTPPTWWWRARPWWWPGTAGAARGWPCGPPAWGPASSSPRWIPSRPWTPP